jgi:hypothetical protein
MATKDISIRIAEAIEIRKQLQSLGVFVVPQNQEKIRAASDEFIKSAASTSVVLKIPFNTMRIQVSFSIHPDIKSGVILIR